MDLTDSSKVFAWLIPVSVQAVDGFCNTVIDCEKDPKFSRYGSFLFYEAIPVHRNEHTSQEESLFVGDEHEDQEPHDYLFDEPLWTGGKFGFSLKAPPRHPHLCWAIGTPGKSGDVDFLVCPQRFQPYTGGIVGRYARMFLNPESGRVVLQAWRTITHFKPDPLLPIPTTLQKSETRILEDRDIIKLGGFTYRFLYTEYSRTSEFDAEFQAYMKTIHGPQWAFNSLLSWTTVGTPLRLGEYCFSANAFAEGTFGKVAVGWKTRSGAAVVVKKFKSPEATLRLSSHWDTMELIGPHVSD